MKPELLEDLYFISLQQICESESLALEAMPRMAENAPPELKQLLERHVGETKKQIERLEHCLKRFNGKGTRAPRPQVIAAVLGEMHERLAEGPDPELASVIMGGAARQIEHVEIGCYAELIIMAKALRFDDATLLNESLQEERRMESQLAGVAESAMEEAAALTATE